MDQFDILNGLDEKSLAAIREIENAITGFTVEDAKNILNTVILEIDEKVIVAFPLSGMIKRTPVNGEISR